MYHLHVYASFAIDNFYESTASDNHREVNVVTVSVWVQLLSIFRKVPVW